MNKFDNKRGKEIIEHLDMIRFTKPELSEEHEFTKGEICVKKTGKDLETSGELRTNA